MPAIMSKAGKELNKTGIPFHVTLIFLSNNVKKVLDYINQIVKATVKPTRLPNGKIVYNLPFTVGAPLNPKNPGNSFLIEGPAADFLSILIPLIRYKFPNETKNSRIIPPHIDLQGDINKAKSLFKNLNFDFVEDNLCAKCC